MVLAAPGRLLLHHTAPASPPPPTPSLPAHTHTPLLLYVRALPPVQSLVTLLWALATLRAQQQLSLVRATTQQLGDRLEAQLGSGPGEKQMPPPAAAAVAAPPADGLPSGDGSSSSFGDRGTLGGRTASSGKRGGDAAEEEEEDEALLAGAATAGSLAVNSEGWHSDSAPAASSISGGDSSTSSTSRRSSSSHGRSGEPPGKGSSLDASMLSTAVWACGQLRHADTRLLQAAAEVLQAYVGDMSAGNVARWAAPLPHIRLWC